MIRSPRLGSWVFAFPFNLRCGKGTVNNLALQKVWVEVRPANVVLHSQVASATNPNKSQNSTHFNHPSHAPSLAPNYRRSAPIMIDQ
jgi:hypothetical protein